MISTLINEANIPVFLAFIGFLSLSVGALITGSIATYAMRSLRNAEANALTSAEWERLYNKLRERVDEAEEGIEYLKKENKALKNGVAILTNQLKQANIQPSYQPKSNPRLSGK